MSLKEKILSADDLPSEPLVVPEWGITEEDGARIRGLTGSELDAYQASFRKFRGNTQTITLQDMRARLVVACLIDAEGNRIFTDADVKQLGQKSGKVLDRLFDRASALSGMTEEAVEEMVANFENGPNDNSTSDLPLDSDGQ